MQFAAKFTKELNKLLSIDMALSTTYHPQTDGQTERTNQELEQYLWLYTNFMQTNWSKWLSQAEFTYNNRLHSATGFSPFYLDHGHHPITPLSVDKPESKNPAVNDFLMSLHDARFNTSLSLQRTSDDMKRFADRKRRHVDYKVGQMVWLDIRNLNTGRPTKKLDVRRTGPFPIIDRISPVAYKLQLPRSWRVHPVFHISLLQPAIVDEDLHPPVLDDTLRPPPDIIDEHEEYDAELEDKHTDAKAIDTAGPCHPQSVLWRRRGQ
jgi:hypothetical protein